MGEEATRALVAVARQLSGTLEYHGRRALLVAEMAAMERIVRERSVATSEHFTAPA